MLDKLTVLTGGAKYDAACTSSGVSRIGEGGLGSTLMAGCCHSFSADGRCVTLLKVLLSNCCIYDCKYCVNRASNDVKRATFTPSELSELTIEFYRRNYIEGLFLSSGVVRSPDYTMEQMIKSLEQLRLAHGFKGYIHAKTIPGASPALIRRMGLLADRVSVNIELPSESSLSNLAPDKTRAAILNPMKLIAGAIEENSEALTLYRNAPAFAPAGHATQMIIGASPETDHHILRLASRLYEKYSLKRVFYSAYIPAVEDSLLPSVDTKPPLLREHRLYQADFLLRKYKFSADEILSENTPNFNPYLDPKCNWAVHNMQKFPLDINTAPYEQLLRIPGIGPRSAGRIVTARRHSKLGTADLKRIGVVLKRAKYFILTADEPLGLRMDRQSVVRALIDPGVFSHGTEQLSLFGSPGSAIKLPGAGDVRSMAEAVQEATLCIAANL